MDPITMMMALGIGLQGFSMISGFNNAQEQKAVVEQQRNLQMMQNQTNADINSINYLKQANEMYAKQLASAASSGASLSSGSFANITNQTYNNQANQEFINQANLNVANLNTLFNAQSQQQQLQSMQTSSIIGGLSNMAMEGFNISQANKTSKPTTQQDDGLLSLFRM